MPTWCHHIQVGKLHGALYLKAWLHKTPRKPRKRYVLVMQIEKKLNMSSTISMRYLRDQSTKIHVRNQLCGVVWVVSGTYYIYRPGRCILKFKHTSWRLSGSWLYARWYIFNTPVFPGLTTPIEQDERYCPRQPFQYANPHLLCFMTLCLLEEQIEELVELSLGAFDGGQPFHFVFRHSLLMQGAI